MQASAEHFDLQHGITNNLDGLTSSNFLPLLAACSKIHRFLRLLAVRFSTSCGFLRLDFQLLAFRKFLWANRKNTTFFSTSCGGLRVLTAQEALAALLAHALFLGCTVWQYVAFPYIKDGKPQNSRTEIYFSNWHSYSEVLTVSTNAFHSTAGNLLLFFILQCTNQ